MPTCRWRESRCGRQELSFNGTYQQRPLTHLTRQASQQTALSFQCQLLAANSRKATTRFARFCPNVKSRLQKPIHNSAPAAGWDGGVGRSLWPCLLPDSEAKMLYIRASFAGKIGFLTWKKGGKNKKWRPSLIGQVLLGWHPLHWTCLINWRFSSLEKFFAVKVADLLYTIDTTRLVLDTSTVLLALMLIKVKVAQAVEAKVRLEAHGGGAPCGADMALIHMSAKINIVGIMWQASRRRRV